MSVRAIAKRMKVSVSTVSRALNNHPEISTETRDRVLKAANEVGYHSTIGKRVTTNISLAFTSFRYFTDFDAMILAGMLRGAAEQGFQVTVLPIDTTKQEGETYTQYFMRMGVRGAVIRTVTHSRQVCEAIAAEEFPSVVVAERFADERVNYIYTESGIDSRRAVEHLIHLNHKRIAFVMNHRPDADHQDRLLGYKAALSAANLEEDESLVLSLPANLEGGKSALNRLLSLPNPPTAVFFADGMPCTGALARAHELGISVPGQLSLVGFDDGNMRERTFPQMTAVCQDASQLGFEAALWLTRGLNTEGKTPPLRKKLHTFFEVRASTGAAPEQPVRITGGVRSQG